MPIIQHKSKLAVKPYKVNQELSKIEQKRSKQSKYAHVYNSRQWKYARKKALELNPCCHICESEGITAEATTVNHMSPLRTFLDPDKPVDQFNAKERRLAFGQDNLETLCLKHHAEEEAAMIKQEKLETEGKILSQLEIDRQQEQKVIKQQREASNRRDSFSMKVYTDENGKDVYMDIF